MTLDRALLLAVLSVGVWLGSNDLRRADLETRLKAIEPTVQDLKTETALQKQKLDAIGDQLVQVNSKLDALLMAPRR